MTTNKNQNELLYILKNTRSHLMNGVSYMIPIVVAGGVLMAIGLLLAGGIEVPETGFIRMIYDTGATALGLMVPVLSAFIAYSIADRAGLAAGFTGGVISNTIGAGFLGGLISGLLAGIIVYYLKKIKLPLELKSLGSIIIVPILSVFSIGLIMYIIGGPVASIMAAAENFLTNASDSNKIILGLIMGAMLAFDMGGPVNKVVFSVMVASVADGLYTVAGPIAVGIAVPPIACGIASMVGKKKFSPEEQEAGKSSIIMGLVGITEGAIPFAAADPLRVIPCLMIGNGIGVATAYMLNVGTYAAWGGMITIPVVQNKIGFIIAQIVGVIATAALLLLIKKNYVEDVVETKDEDIDIEFNF